MELNERHVSRLMRPVRTSKTRADLFDERYDNGLGIWCIHNNISATIYHKLKIEAGSAADAMPQLIASSISATHTFEKIDKSINPSSYHPEVALGNKHPKVPEHSRQLAELLVGMVEPTFPNPGLVQYVRRRYGKKSDLRV